MSVGNFEKSVARGERYPLTVQFLTVSDSYVSFGHVAIDTLRFIELHRVIRQVHNVCIPATYSLQAHGVIQYSINFSTKYNQRVFGRV